MNARKLTVAVLAMLTLCATLALGSAKPVPATTTLTETGEQLRDRYSKLLAKLQAEAREAIPAINEQQLEAFFKARAGTKAATVELNALLQQSGKIKTAQALVDHAKGKWIHGAEEKIALAEEALKKATTDAARETAKTDLSKWQANREDGLKALKERQEALDKAKIDEPRLLESIQAAKESLARAQAHELVAANALLSTVNTVLSSDALDAQLAKLVVLAEATPRGLAEFAQESKEHADLVELLLGDADLMKEMLVNGGAKDGKYGQAMKIYTEIQKATPRVRKDILYRLALGTCLEHAVPIRLRQRPDESTPAFADPVKRFLHYEKAYLDHELDPSFPTMTAWECRMIVNSDAPDQVLTWGRAMLRNYRPDHVLNPDYGWRYSAVVRTDVAYRHSDEYQDSDSLEFFQNVIRNGGICGRRAFFGRYIIQSFGLPAWGVAQHAHAAVGRWTPAGWVINLGADWQYSWYEGRTGLDFLLETRARKNPREYLKALRAQWIGLALGEQKYDSMKDGSGGPWHLIALFEKQRIVAEAKPMDLAALGKDLGESNESPAVKASAMEKAIVTEEDKKIVTGPNGAITIPAAACSGPNHLVKSYLGGQQMICGGTFSCEFSVPSTGKYALTVRVVTVHGESQVLLTPNKAKGPIALTLPDTLGAWQTTNPIEIGLGAGKNQLTFSKPASSFALKEITLVPVKSEEK